MTGCRDVERERYCRAMASRVLAPDLSGVDKPKGPPAYFPSIEKTYGRPVQEWIDIAVERLDAGGTHMAVVDVLKSEHGPGHGHANAVVAYTKAALAKS